MSAQRVDKKIHEKQNICFIHGDSTNLSDFHNKQFDYVTISMALHEMPHDVREKVLLESKRIGKKIIIADYVSPQPFTFAGIRTRIVEFFAGIGHFTAFLNFQKNHGIHPLLTRFGLSVCHDFMIKNGTIRIVVVH
ncbi:methyltransferase domain-containing protein [Candidatus Peregrinibacteria bacterium]|nr:methyltransferase domain-containing protein [Candidatus Peregrinibacteria bacterium]